MLELDLDHDFEPGLPLELYMRSEVHRLKPHIKSLIRVHSPGLVALAALADVPSELLMMHGSFWPQAMPVWEEPELVRDRSDARRLVGILGDEPSISGIRASTTMTSARHSRPSRTAARWS